MSHKKRGQVWSIDLVVGLLIFALIAVIFYALIANKGGNTKIEDYTAKGEDLTNKFIEKGLIDPITGELNETVYNYYAALPYEDLKEELGVSGEFCLFIESGDSTPRLIVLGNRTGIGNPDFEINGLPCGADVSP